MTLRPALPAEEPAVTAFLRRHEASSIFPLANLASPDAAGQRIWCHAPEGAIAGVMALAPSGFLMPQWPGLEAGAVLRGLAGQRLSALIGPADQVRLLVAALIATQGARTRLVNREPLCRLDLQALTPPDPAGTRLAPIRPEDAETVIAFRMAYDIETAAQPAATARSKAEGDLARWIGAGSHRLLWRGDQPVALTGLNAKLPDVVQVGGVFVPKALRNQGLARRAVAFHLAEARAAGAVRAVLFAATDAALRAYQAIGFTQIGWMSLALLQRPVTLTWP
jgi:GNAT superfamily N-acetyltransferase